MTTPETQALHLEGWTLCEWAEDYWIRDLDLADRAGMKQPRDIRPIIRKAIDDESVTICDDSAGTAGAVGPAGVTIHDNSAGAARAVRAPQVRIERMIVPKGNGAGQEAAEYFLNEEAALLIITRLRTRTAIQLTRAVIQVFVMVRKGRAANEAAAASLAEQERAQLAAMQKRFDAQLANMQGEFDKQLAAMKGRHEEEHAAPSISRKLGELRRNVDALMSGDSDRKNIRTESGVRAVIHEEVLKVQPALLVSQLRGAVMEGVDQHLGGHAHAAMERVVKGLFREEGQLFEKLVKYCMETVVTKALDKWMEERSAFEIRDRVRSDLFGILYGDTRDMWLDMMRKDLVRLGVVDAQEARRLGSARGDALTAGPSPTEDDTRAMVRWMAVQFVRDDMRTEIRHMIEESIDRHVAQKFKDAIEVVVWGEHARDVDNIVRDEVKRSARHFVTEALAEARVAQGSEAPRTANAEEKFRLACELMHEGANQTAAARGVGISAKTLREALRKLAPEQLPQPPPEVRQALGPSALPRLKRQVLRNRLRALAWEPKHVTDAIEWLGTKLESRPLDELLSELMKEQSPK